MAARKRRTADPTLGELQELLDGQAKMIVKIEETLDMLVRSVCNEGVRNMQFLQIRAMRRATQRNGGADG